MTTAETLLTEARTVTDALIASWAERLSARFSGAMTVIVVDICDSVWLLEIEAIAAA